MTTAFLSHPVFQRHEVPAGHPECPQRLAAITDELIAAGVYDLLRVYDAPEATREALCRAHLSSHVAALEHIEAGDALVAIDADTYVGPHSLPAARRAAGAAVEATDLVLSGAVRNAFCCVRPPGHHATRDAAMGFCLFNNVVVGAEHALEHHGLQRVAILDFDVHHGNGTEQIVAGDERILYLSSFQHPFYPYGDSAPAGPNVVKSPLRAGCGGQHLRKAIEERWAPALERFSPEMIFVSAGFDGHVEDSMSDIRLVDDDYRWISDWIVAVADHEANGRVVSCLEGGYALHALARCTALHIRALAGL